MGKLGKPTTVGTQFAWIAKDWNPKTFKNYNHARTSASNELLRDACDHFDIKPWGLARLLGLPWLNSIYLWLDGTRRPCQMYMARLVKLYSLKAKGLELDTVHHIDWNGTGEIHFKEIVTFLPDGSVAPRPRRQKTISPEDQELRDKYMKYTPR